MGCRNCLRNMWRAQTLWISIFIVVVFMPLPILFPGSVANCGYCVLVIGMFWVTEVIPLAVTSLLPVFLFPVFGVMTAAAVCRSYVKDTLMLFLGSLIVAVAVEKWNLHKRLALRTLTLVGPEPKWLLLGVMLPTWFLSMWMSNTATTAMMIPIVTAILQQIRECQAIGDAENLVEEEERGVNMVATTNEKHRMGQEDNEGDERLVLNRAKSEEQYLSFARTFALGTAFSANIGGVATLTGTPPNIIFKGLADSLFKLYGADNPVNFANWLILGIPLSVILIIFLWIWLQIYSQGIRCLLCCKKDRTSYAAVQQTLKKEYARLGPMAFPEILVTICFVAMALLWVTRNPGFVPGWGDLFRPGYVKDSTPAIFISVILFILPSQPLSFMGCCRSRRATISEVLQPRPSYEPLLDWKTVNARMAWGVLLLMGGGFALADGCEVSGLSQWVSEHLGGLSAFPDWIIMMLLTLLIAVATEFTSNAATTTLFVPIVGNLAVKLGINPLYFMLPCTVSASLAFLLPVATPPNAIVFATGFLKVKDMFLAGLPINIFAIIMLNVAVNTWVSPLYDLTVLPPEFGVPINSSLASTTNITAATLNSYTTVSSSGV